MTNPLQSFVQTTIAVGISLVMVVGMFVLGPFIEGRYFPVTTDVQVTLISETSEKMVFAATGTKLRNCSLIDARVLVEQSNGQPLAKGAIYVVEDGVGNKTRAIGFQDLGTWAIHPSGNRVHVESTYSCHKLWNTEMKLGEWTR